MSGHNRDGCALEKVSVRKGSERVGKSVRNSLSTWAEIPSQIPKRAGWSRAAAWGGSSRESSCHGVTHNRIFLPMAKLTIFSNPIFAPILLRRGSERVAGWASGSHHISQLKSYFLKSHSKYTGHVLKPITTRLSSWQHTTLRHIWASEQLLTTKTKSALFQPKNTNLRNWSLA